MAFILFDANNFYVSAELVLKPQYANHPVVVIGSNDGCVISRSQQAKDIGIKMGEPAHFVRNRQELWPHNVKFFSANFPLYGDMSARMVSVIASMVPALTQYSVDEVFARCPGMSPAQLDTLSSEVRHKVLQWTGLPIGAGIGLTPTLAKVASYLGKRVLRTGACSILADDQRLPALEATPIAEVWGIGPAFAEKLVGLGITNALQLANAPVGLIASNFPIGVRRTQAELQGHVSIDIAEPDVPRQMINVSRTFGQSLSCERDLAAAIVSFASAASEKLNRQQSVCGVIRVYLRPVSTSYVRSAATTVSLPVRTRDPRILASASVQASMRIFRQGVSYAKAGISLMDIIEPSSMPQQSLFESHDVDGCRVATLIASINDRFGRGSLAVARSLASDKWKPRADMLSGSSTTDISNLPVVF
ncbi:Y-family DNA polymerase [Pseudomonas sp. GOM6]|uniref:Y-family DNA polymerase n=1 Tax=Pseudomonas sp. GOM6 TaxID=3036944 RepID=UPI0024098C4C|nr:Y-family DNA polymerase [Pseudomonas sp. GOM6]MDG1580943.1 DUF4113 domain-containing protein [Pseudomonas sp. GOM6]